MNICNRIILCAAALLVSVSQHAQRTVSLAGTWELALPSVEHPQLTKDPQTGMPVAKMYSDIVALPGSLLTNGKGDPVTVNTRWTGSLYDSSYYFNPYMAPYRQPGQTKFPFFLTPERHYVGEAWYRRSVYVPDDWKDQHITIYIERPHIETTVYVNGERVGHEMSLSTPHVFDVTKQVRCGQRNEVVVCVYNGIENVCVGQDSHSVTDQTQGNWNGMTGRLELRAQWKKLYIKRVSIKPDSVIIKHGRRRIKERTAKLTVQLGNHLSRILPLWDYNVTVSVRRMAKGKPTGKAIRAESKLARGDDELTFTFFENDDLMQWDEFHPNLYQLTVEAGEDIYVTQFGLRSVRVQGRQLYINERPLFLRGTVENCCFPETGYPPTDEEDWVRIFTKCKEYGLNHVRFHSYCPPEAAFCAADRVGIYLQVEAPSWPNHGVRLRRGMAVDQYLLEESKRIVDEYGNHPSFLMMAAGNEPAGDWVAYCNDWVRQMHQHDSTKIYCGASVGGGWAWDDGSEYHVKGGGRGLDWDRKAPQSADDYFAAIEFPRNYKSGTPNQSPIVAHEQGQWCAFPDFREISLYTGAYKAGNFEIFRDLLRSGGMEPMAQKFLMASGHLQTLCYKYEIERNLRTADYAGFQLLSLNDYSGQGTALVGPLNVFWREKGYVSADQWRQFCFYVVPLARFPKFVYSSSDTLVVPVEAYNAFYAHLTKVNATYSIVDDSMHIVANGTLSRNGYLKVGKNNKVGTVRFPLSDIKKATKLKLSVQLSGRLQNEWEFWVYPDDTTLPAATAIHIADSLDATTLKVLNEGGTVLLTAAGKVKLGSDVKQTYLPVFWNTSWFKMRPPHTTGAYIDKLHPLFKYDFPTDDWSNLNWWELLNKAQVMNLMELPAGYQPPIQPIDTWHVSRKLAMLIEARVLKGRLLMTTMDISSDLDRRIVARQMRQAIIRYMQSDDFCPTLTLTPDVIRDFYTKQAPPVNMFTNESPDELKPKIG